MYTGGGAIELASANEIACNVNCACTRMFLPKSGGRQPILQSDCVRQ